MIIFILLFSILLTGCKAVKENSTKQKSPIIIPVCFLVDQESGQSENIELVNAFNEAYKGIYQLDVEWITDSAEGYRARLKRLNGLDQLPAVITDVGFDSDFYQLLLAHNRLVNLKPYMEQDEEWMNSLDAKIRKSCEEADGSIYMSPLNSTISSYAGFYYNKELFKKAGIQKFPDTWDDFFQCLDVLKEHNITPLALHGGSSYWTALLIASNYMASTPEGAAFLKIQFPANYQNASMKRMMTMLKRLYQYSDKDALEIEHGEARKRFIEGKNAIMANGGWMMLSLPEDVREKTGFAPFPENILMNEPKMSAWAVTTSYDKDITNGAVEFLKFRAANDQKETELFWKNKDLDLVETEYRSAIQNVKNITPNYQLKWEFQIQNGFLVEQIPSYINEKITLNQFLKALTDQVTQINKEK